MGKAFNIYCTDWLFGFGRFVVITTSQYDENGKDITSEAYILSFDTAPNVKRFKARSIHYRDNPETQDMIKIDTKFMEQEAQRQARNLIYEFQYQEYKKKSDPDLMDSSYNLVSCEQDVLITLKISGDYESELKSISDNTKAGGLKEYIDLILSFPKLEIRDYDGK